MAKAISYYLNAKAQRRRVFSFRTRNARMERKFRLFCVFRVQFILTTDIKDFSDVNHERKRVYLLNPCNLCSFN